MRDSRTRRRGKDLQAPGTQNTGAATPRSGSGRPEVFTLKLPPAPVTVREPLAAGLAILQIVEEHPLVLLPYPPDFSPDFMPLLTRTSQRGHRLISPSVVLLSDLL